MSRSSVVAWFLFCGAVLMSTPGCLWGGYPPGNPLDFLLYLDTNDRGTITLTPPGENLGSIAGLWYPAGMTVNIEITPNSGYVFVRIDWVGGTQTFDNPCQVVMDTGWQGTVVLEPE